MDSADDDLTWDRLLGAASPAPMPLAVGLVVPAAVVDQGGKGKAKPSGAKASKAAVVDKGSKGNDKHGKGKGKGNNKNKHG